MGSGRSGDVPSRCGNDPPAAAASQRGAGVSAPTAAASRPPVANCRAVDESFRSGSPIARPVHDAPPLNRADAPPDPARGLRRRPRACDAQRDLPARLSQGAAPGGAGGLRSQGARHPGTRRGLAGGVRFRRRLARHHGGRHRKPPRRCSGGTHRRAGECVSHGAQGHESLDGGSHALVRARGRQAGVRVDASPTVHHWSSSPPIGHRCSNTPASRSARRRGNGSTGPCRRHS